MRGIKPRSEALVDLVQDLIMFGLGKKMCKDIEVIISPRVAKNFVKSTRKAGILWIDCKTFKRSEEDPVFWFWKFVQSQKLKDECHVVFTNTVDSPSWKDLDSYRYVKFGSIVLVVYDSITHPGVKPSQHGIFLNME